MKIALIIEKYAPAAGGNERSTDQIARRLIARGHSVTVLTTAKARGVEDPLPGGEIRVAEGCKPRSAVGLWRFRRWAMRQLDEGGFDVSLSVTLAVPAAVVQPRGGTVRETLERNVAMRPTPRARLLKRFLLGTNLKQQALLRAERLTLASERVKKIVAISGYVADQLVYHYRIPEARIEMIPNAAAVERVGPAQRKALSEKIRRQFQLNDTDVLFLFPAMNPELKGVRPLLRAFAKLRERHPEARLIAAGNMSYPLQQFALKLGLGEAVRWVGPSREMDSLYATCDVTVLPSWYDPASKVVLESLLHGTPAISTRYNGASQWIVSPTGEPVAHLSPFSGPVGSIPAAAGRVIHAPDDVDGLTAAMSDLCDPEERRRCALATQGLDAQVSMDRHVDRLEALLTSLASKHDAQPTSV